MHLSPNCSITLLLGIIYLRAPVVSFVVSSLIVSFVIVFFRLSMKENNLLNLHIHIMYNFDYSLFFLEGVGQLFIVLAKWREIKLKKASRYQPA